MPDLEAVIFVTDPPEFEIRGGLVHITQSFGKTRLERVMRLNTFLRAIEMARRAVAEYEMRGSAQVIDFPRVGSGH